MPIPTARNHFNEIELTAELVPVDKGVEETFLYFSGERPVESSISYIGTLIVCSILVLESINSFPKFGSTGFTKQEARDEYTRKSDCNFPVRDKNRKGQDIFCCCCGCCRNFR